MGGKHKQKTYKIKFASLKILIKLANPLAKLVNKQKAQITNNRNKRGKSSLILRS